MYASIYDIPSSFWSAVAPEGSRDMISRRRILSRSRDDLNQESVPMEDEEDVWYQKEKLYKDHIHEVLGKWTQIDDEIWAKVICVERNRRVAKAYARTPVLTINGSDDGFDGYRIGLNGFDNPMRDAKTEEVKRHIGHGVKIKMDTAGNILIKRVSKSNVYVRDGMNVEENSLSSEALKLTNGALEMDKPVKLFDMKKFQHNVSKELKRAYPDRRRLECQCISPVIFVRNEPEILDCPCWLMIINIVAMDMLKSKLPPIQKQLPVNPKARPRLPIPDEDPYSLPSNGSSTSRERDRKMSSDKPPKLPPRDAIMGAYHIPKPDYESRDEENKYRLLPHLQSSRKKAPTGLHDDPYYCGFRAHIPNFAKTRSSPNSKMSTMGYGRTTPMSQYPRQHRDRSNSYDTSNDSGIIEDPYSSIYGRLPGMPRTYQTREVRVGEWDGY
uniref:MH2 domain-containing protein n=1 Tax=Strigamia maritima TaxID=126957 RepID=T1IQT5_STRMM